jgi:vanadium chloroperoxidase
MADAGIASWFYKYKYQLWRPVLGIREYDDSFWAGGEPVSHGLHPRCDPWWVPLGSPRTNEPGRRSFTPPFPAYPSGHATFGAAAFEAIGYSSGSGRVRPTTCPSPWSRTSWTGARSTRMGRTAGYIGATTTRYSGRCSTTP